MTRPLYQQDAYLQAVTSEVLECQPAGEGRHAVVPAETVLYPEGGGQPADHGWIDGQPVLGLEARPDGAVAHIVERPAPVGGRVELRLDWARRFDHMQQHTAQHLLTALAQDRAGAATTAFHLGPRRCDIELDCPDLPPPLLEQLEAEANAEIRRARPVRPRLVSPDELPGLELRTRGLPGGHTGPVRLVQIEGLDLNTCGGTHVASTAELQAIKLLGTEHLRGGTRLFYLAGGRVLGALGETLERERACTDLLTCGPEEHLAAIQRLAQADREGRRRLRAGRLELAALLGRELAAGPDPAQMHRPEGDMELLRAVAGAFREQRPEGLALLTAGERQGVFLLLGPEDLLRELGPAVAAALQGKGGGARGQFQGKATRLDLRDQALELLHQWIPGAKKRRKVEPDEESA